MICKLPINCGTESADIVVFKREQELIYIASTTAPQCTRFSMPDRMVPMVLNPDDANWTTSIMTLDDAEKIIRWCSTNIKEVHIKENCDIESVPRSMVDTILNVVDVSFLHPCSVRPIHPIVAKMSSKKTEIEGVLTSEGHYGMIPTVVIHCWKIPWNDSNDVICVPCPFYMGREGDRKGVMNGTVMLLDLVHRNVDLPRTFNVKLPTDGNGFPSRVPFPQFCSEIATPTEATITYFTSCGDRLYENGLH